MKKYLFLFLLAFLTIPSWAATNSVYRTLSVNSTNGNVQPQSVSWFNFTQYLTLVNPSNKFYGFFYGDLGNSTNIPGAEVTGTLASSTYSLAYLLDGSRTANAAGLTNIPGAEVTGTLPSSTYSLAYLLDGSRTANAAGLTNIPGAEVTGTLPGSTYPLAATNFNNSATVTWVYNGNGTWTATATSGTSGVAGEFMIWTNFAAYGTGSAGNTLRYAVLMTNTMPVTTATYTTNADSAMEVVIQLGGNYDIGAIRSTPNGDTGYLAIMVNSTNIYFLDFGHALTYGYFSPAASKSCEFPINVPACLSSGDVIRVTGGGTPEVAGRERFWLRRTF